MSLIFDVNIFLNWTRKKMYFIHHYNSINIGYYYYFYAAENGKPENIKIIMFSYFLSFLIFQFSNKCRKSKLSFSAHPRIIIICRLINKVLIDFHFHFIFYSIFLLQFHSVYVIFCI